VRQNNSADEQAFIDEWRQVADKIHITDLHNWAGTLNDHTDVQFPCYRLWLTFTVLWDGRVSMCCADFDGATSSGTCARRRSPRSGRPPLPRRPPPAPGVGRTGNLPLLRPPQKRLTALDYEASVTGELAN
jgi:hypothetical protein